MKCPIIFNRKTLFSKNSKKKPTSLMDSPYEGSLTGHVNSTSENYIRSKKKQKYHRKQKHNRV